MKCVAGHDGGDLEACQSLAYSCLEHLESIRTRIAAKQAATAIVAPSHERKAQFFVPSSWSSSNSTIQSKMGD